MADERPSELVNEEKSQGGGERPTGLDLDQNRKRTSSKLSGSGEGTSQPQTVPRGLPYLRELLLSRTRGQQAGTPTVESPQRGEEMTDDAASSDVQVLKMGNLYKTSQSRRPDADTGPTRQRRFRLTPESLEYFQLFSHVKIRRTYPLTSVERIDHPVGEDRLSFQLIFSTYVMTLRAESQSEAEDWVEKIRGAWKEWQLPTPAIEEDTEHSLAPRAGSPPVTLPTTLDSIAEEDETKATTPQASGALPHTLSLDTEPVSGSSEVRPIPPPPQSDDIKPEDRPRSQTHSGILRRFSSEADFNTYDRRRLSKRARRIQKVAKLAPRLTKQQPHLEQSTSSKLHSEYAMIKYPRTRWSIPSEKIFKVDKDNLMILWRRNESSHHKLKSALSLHRVLEIREGQLTRKFDQFPYEEVEGQSFSLMIEEVTKRYVRLTSLDLICDCEESYSDWINGLRDKTNHLSCSIFPSEQYEHTDPTVLWLKKLWTVGQSNHEMPQKESLCMITTFQPTTPPTTARQILRDSHHHQFRHTYLRGNALRWDGFVLMFNLICGMKGRLHALFEKYAVQYTRLGMTERELAQFLMQECHWDEASCNLQDLQALISRHDYHHRAFKKYAAKGNPLDYQIGSTLLSYAGFLSFLRSKDNSVIDLEHTSVYQDMDQPLSHYFINSSHNTYLEADQLYGTSSTDAYIRVLLQGCRCIEIDCWDDTLNVTGVGEPIIYHGFTLTTKLPFRDVIQTIKVRHLRQSVNSLERSGQLTSTVYLDDDQELIFEETAEDLKKLIVYCKAISIKPWSFERQQQTQVTDMFSFGEPSALRRAEKYPREMLACTERQLVRTYPRGTRFDSSNYPAMNLWRCGVQMVALNFQYPDVYMHLNQGLFRHNGGCGYVLKPAVMRQADGEEGTVPFNPKMTEPHPDVTPVNLEIELLSGQRLCFWRKKYLSVSVDISTHGIPYDCGEMQTATNPDPFWPQWEEGKYVYRKRVLMPELCLVYFKVEVTSGGAARKTVLYGQNCIPLVSLLPGIKFVPLRTTGGELIPESGLFLRIVKEEEEGGRREEGRRVAGGRRKLSHQECIVEESGEFDYDIDVTQSIFPSAPRRRLVKQQERSENTIRFGARSPTDGGGRERTMSGPSVLDSLSSMGSGDALSSLSPLRQGRRSDEAGQGKRRGKEELEVVVEVHDHSSEGSSSEVEVRGLSPGVEVFSRDELSSSPQAGLQGSEEEEEES